MEKEAFNYQIPNDTVVFTDALSIDSPHISKKPRNHESLFFVTKGTLVYEKNKKSEIVGEGQVGYIARGSIDKSAAYLCDEVSYIAINFTFDKQNPTPSKTLPFNTLCSTGVAYNYEKLFKQALNHFLSKTPGYIAICNGIITQIIGYLYNEHSIEFNDLGKMKKTEKAIEFLKQNYSDSNLRVSDLAKSINLSEKHFRRLFLQVHKKNPYTYLQEFRISKAELLLLNTSKSISDIALQCGFSDIYSFSHCFKSQNGISPSEYRNKF